VPTLWGVTLMTQDSQGILENLRPKAEKNTHENTASKCILTNRPRTLL